MFSWSVVKDYIIADEFRSFIPIMKLISIWDNNGRKQKKTTELSTRKLPGTRDYSSYYSIQCAYMRCICTVCSGGLEEKSDRSALDFQSSMNTRTQKWIELNEVCACKEGERENKRSVWRSRNEKKHTETRKWTWKRSGIYSETDPWKLLLFPLEIRVSIIIGALHRTVDYCSQSVFHPLILTPSLCVSLSSSPHSLLFIDQLQTTKYKTFHILFVFRLWLLLCFARLQTHQILI